MDENIYERLVEKFGPVSWYSGPNNGVPGEWFVIEVNPLPPIAEREEVVVDICQGKAVHVYGGRIFHSRNCNSTNHKFSSKMRHVKEVIDSLTEDVFRVAVFIGQPDILGGQPVAISLEPEIDHFKYPDHPHLNSFHRVIINDKVFFLPASFCYIEDIDSLGKDQFSRLLNAFEEISIWLFRHQIWLATRKEYSVGTWIGPQVINRSFEHYPYFLDPQGRCRCGKNQLYAKCHLQYDLKKLAKKIASEKKIKFSEAQQNLQKKIINVTQNINQIKQLSSTSLLRLKRSFQ